jgi:hypothetical protein
VLFQIGGTAQLLPLGRASPLQLSFISSRLNARATAAEPPRKRERDHPAVLLAATVVSNAAEGKDFMMHARIVAMKALHRNDGGR